MTLSTFYITFGFSDDKNFSSEVTQSLMVRTGSMQRADESNTDTGGGGYLGRKGLLRGVLDVEFWHAMTTAQDPYPNGQDVEDIETLKANIAGYNYMRITASNLESFANFPALWPLPMTVVHTGDLVADKDEAKGRHIYRTTFLEPEYYSGA